MFTSSPQVGTPRTSGELPTTQSGVRESDLRQHDDEEYDENQTSFSRRSSAQGSFPGDSALVASITQELNRGNRRVLTVEDQTHRDRQLAMHLQQRYALVRPPPERLGSSERLNTPAWMTGEPQVRVVEIDPTPENSENEEPQTKKERAGTPGQARRGHRVVAKMKQWGKAILYGSDNRPVHPRLRESEAMADRRNGGPGPPTGAGSARSVMKNQDTCVIN